MLFGLRAGRLGPSHWSSIPRSVAQLCLEDPIETAVLLSLAGVRSILANQWPTLLRDNALRASVLWENLLALGKPIGRAARVLQKMGAGDLSSHGTRLSLSPAESAPLPGPAVPTDSTAPVGAGTADPWGKTRGR